jgi:predicted amidophosphoribosyltransferase
MATVRELTALYENVMLAPRHGPGVCASCFNLTAGFDRCYACTHQESWLHVVAPISYSVAHEQLHHVLASYKRLSGDVADRLRIQLAAVLWRYLDRHETCLARATGVERFGLITTVPSSDRERDERQPLRRIVSTLVGPTRGRHQRLLRRSEAFVPAHTFHAAKFIAVRPLDGEPVLLVDDTWTTGANAQSAASALRAAGAGPLAVVVIGRHVNRGWHENNRRLQALAQPFDWNECVLCTPARRAPAPDENSRVSLPAADRPSPLDRPADTVEPRLAVAEEQDVGINRLERVERAKRLLG